MEHKSSGNSPHNTQQLDRDGKAPAPEREATAPKPEEAKKQLQPSDPPKKKHPRRRLILFILLGVGAVAGIIFGYRWWQSASTHADTDDAYVTGHLHPLSARINDTVGQVLVDDNQLVRRGQLLVKLDPSDYEVQVRQAQANLEAASRQANAALANVSLASKNSQGQTTSAQGNIDAAVASVAGAQAAVAKDRANISTDQAKIVKAEADLRRAKSDYDRYSFLYQTGAVSAFQLDAYRSTYQEDVADRNSAAQQVKADQAQLVADQKNVTNTQGKLLNSRGGLQTAQATAQQTKVNESQYQAALATAAQAEAQLKNAELQLSYTNITAPTDGRVGNKTAEVGQRVQTGQALMSVVEPLPWVIANFKETQLKQMRPGQAAEIKVDALGHRAFRGWVDSLAPASGAEFALLPPDNATGNFTKIVQRIPVKIVFDRQSVKGYEAMIAPGMSVEVSVAHP